MIEKEFICDDYPCIIRKGLSGVRCGYVGIPKGHPYYRKAYEKIPVDTYRGLTFGGMKLPEKSRFPEKGIYWIGFDCGYDTKKSMDFVEEELKSLICELEMP